MAGSRHTRGRARREPFLERAQANGGVPAFVERELHTHLGCGIFANSFVRVHCDGCGHDRLVRYSCKGRGFCASCGGRRIADTAAWLRDSVLVGVPPDADGRRGQADVGEVTAEVDLVVCGHSAWDSPLRIRDNGAQVFNVDGRAVLLTTG